MTGQPFATCSRRYRERGDSLAEFALIIPVLLLIVIAILDFGRAIYAYGVVANCAREGARYGAIQGHDDEGIEARVREAAVGLDRSESTLTIDITRTITTVHVAVGYNFELITPLVAQVIGRSSFPLASSTTMYTGY